MMLVWARQGLNLVTPPVLKGNHAQVLLCSQLPVPYPESTLSMRYKSPIVPQFLRQSRQSAVRAGQGDGVMFAQGLRQKDKAGPRGVPLAPFSSPKL
jgi:hypothetical protein